MKQIIAKAIDHAVLHPIHTTKDLEKNCLICKKYNVASICVKPHHIKEAKNLLSDSEVLISTVIDFPHGNNPTEIKIKQIIKTIEDGAEEVDAVINISKVIEHDWDYISKEVEQMTNITHEQNKIIKIIFETCYLDNYMIEKLTKICNKYKADYVKTSTGFGFIKQENGLYKSYGANIDVVKIMLDNSDYCKVKASGGIRDFKTAELYINMGVKRLGTSSTEQILS